VTSLVRTSALALLLVATPYAAFAQTSSGRAPRPIAACSDTVVGANLTRVTLYQHLWLTDTSSAVVMQVGLINQRIAAAARSALGGLSDTSLAAADSLGVWQDELKELPFVIVLHRDGPSRWYVSHAADTVNPKLSALYARVLQSIPPDSLWIVWPDGEATDSLSVRIDVMSNYPLQQSAIRATSSPIATARAVQLAPAVVTHWARPHYPDDAASIGIVGKVLLGFVVDTNGRADPETIRVIEPTAATLASSRFAHFYHEFIYVSRDVVLRNRYAPARLGGCLIKQRVQQPFNYAGHRTDR